MAHVPLSMTTAQHGTITELVLHAIKDTDWKMEAAQLPICFAEHMIALEIAQVVTMDTFFIKIVVILFLNLLVSHFTIKNAVLKN